MKKIVYFIVLLATLVSLCSCEDTNKAQNTETTVAETEKIEVTIDNFFDYFGVEASFENVQWDSYENTIRNEMIYNGTADFHIKVINKNNIEGVTVTLKIEMANDDHGDAVWIDAYFNQVETFTRTIDIASAGVTDISIPRSTIQSDNNLRLDPPTNEDIKISVESVSVN